MFGGISIWQLAIVLVIVILIFGTKKLRNLGGDVGSAVKNFKSAMDEGKEDGKEDDAKKVADDTADASAKAEETVEAADKEKS